MKKWRWALLMAALLAGLMIMPAAADVTIPADTTEIDDYAFYQNAGLTGKLTIPYGVQRIGEYAFAGCTGLRGTVVIPETVTSLADTAFDSTGLTVVYNAQSLRTPNWQTSPLAETPLFKNFHLLIYLF